MSDIEYLELGIIEFEKHLEDDPNNEWLKRCIKGMKSCKQRLEAIDNANPSEALEETLKDIAIDLEYDDDPALKDRYYGLLDLKQNLLKAQEDEKLKVDICEMFGLDNLFPYNDTKAILKELEEYMDKRNQLWVDFMKTSKESKEQEKVLEVLKKHKINIYRILDVESVSQYNEWENDNLVEEEFELLKRYL